MSTGNSRPSSITSKLEDPTFHPLYDGSPSRNFSNYEERSEGSYTIRLFQDGVQRRAQKVGEERVEVALAAMAPNGGLTGRGCRPLVPLDRIAQGQRSEAGGRSPNLGTPPQYVN